MPIFLREPPFINLQVSRIKGQRLLRVLLQITKMFADDCPPRMQRVVLKDVL
jgi:hypothetical protein